MQTHNYKATVSSERHTYIAPQSIKELGRLSSVRVLYPNGWRYRHTYFISGTSVILLSLGHPVLPNSKENLLSGGGGR